MNKSIISAYLYYNTLTCNVFIATQDGTTCLANAIQIGWGT